MTAMWQANNVTMRQVATQSRLFLQLKFIRSMQMRNILAKLALSLPLVGLVLMK
jgi:hypothetical protein